MVWQVGALGLGESELKATPLRASPAEPKHTDSARPGQKKSPKILPRKSQNSPPVQSKMAPKRKKKGRNFIVRSPAKLCGSAEGGGGGGEQQQQRGTTSPVSLSLRHTKQQLHTTSNSSHTHSLSSLTQQLFTHTQPLLTYTAAHTAPPHT